MSLLKENYQISARILKNKEIQNHILYYRTMLKKFTLCSLVAVVSSGWYTGLQAQTHTCGNDLGHIATFHPEVYQEYQTFYNNLQEYISSMDISQDAPESGPRIIPVVVHVLHTGGAENISKAQIQSQIVALNKDFSRMNPGLATLPGPGMGRFVFDSLATDSEIEFRLATIDPQGNCTDGIIRVYTEKATNALTSNATKFKSQSYWDRSKYLNIWVVNTIESSGGNTVLGFAQFPFINGGIQFSNTDGITVIHNSFGTMGTASGGTGATSTHEIGHWLGLRHIWGDAECGDDGVDDTPIHKQPNYCFINGNLMCPYPIPKPATCINLTPNSSREDSLRRDSIGEMWMNFMDYTSDQYLWMFTHGQKRVFDFTFSNYAFRGSLITNANNIATGTDDNAVPCTPTPAADFWSTKGSPRFWNVKMVCEGEPITFTNGTFNGTADTYNWTFEGGTPASSTQLNPTVQYANAGLYDVSLTATSNVSGASTKTRPDYVRVSANAPDEVSYAYYDAFEWGSAFEQGKWVIINEGSQTNKWEQFSFAGYNSSKSMIMRNENNIQLEPDLLISPSYDLTQFDNDELTFRFAYAAKTNNPYVDQPDQLRVYYSTDCGSTWMPRPVRVGNSSLSTVSGSSLITAGLAPNGFVPGSSDDWKLGTVDLNVIPTNQQGNVRIMFEWISGGPSGNNFFLDEVNIRSRNNLVGMEEEVYENNTFSVFPNPVSETSKILFNVQGNSDVVVDVLDMAGRKVLDIYSGNMNAGEYTLDLQHSRFSASGMYMVRLTTNGKSAYQKIIVQ